jgi:RNA polymerase sporulation-specific sigma factor
VSGRPASFEATLKQYEPLMNKLVRRWPIPGFDYEDGLQIAAIGLWKAWETWDPQRGGSFLTHAFNCITRRLQVELKRAGCAKRIPRSAISSLDALCAGEEGGTASARVDMIESTTPSPERVAEAADTLRRVVVAAQSERNAQVVLLHAAGESRSELAERFGVSASRIYAVLTETRDRFEKAA